MLMTLPTRCRLRKVKMDQRKLMDNANTITDMAKVASKKHKKCRRASVNQFSNDYYRNNRNKIDIFPSSKVKASFSINHVMIFVKTNRKLL